SLGDYQTLLNEAAQNKQRALKAAKKGVPVNMAQIDADLAAASALFNQATAALIQQCMRAAQQAQAPQAPAPAQPQTGQAPPANVPQGQGSAGLKSKLDEAEQKLADDAKACRPIKARDYQPLVDEMRQNLKAGRKALEKGAPVDVDKLLSDSDRASRLL